MVNQQRIKSPEEVTKLMEDLCVSHKAGLKPQGNLVFWVDLPPLSGKEKAEIDAKKTVELEASEEIDDNSEDLYGAWI